MVNLNVFHNKVSIKVKSLTTTINTFALWPYKTFYSEQTISPSLNGIFNEPNTRTFVYTCLPTFIFDVMFPNQVVSLNI